MCLNTTPPTGWSPPTAPFTSAARTRRGSCRTTISPTCILRTATASRESLSSERVRQAFDDGETALSAEYRTLDGEGHYTWVRITLVPIRGSDGKYRRLIGSIKDIDRDKRREQEFKDQSRRDPLTGLYNRRYTEVMVNRFLEKSGPAASGALFIIDIDDFKAVNDHLGHLLGDAVLRDVSERITQLFRSTDIVGRIGGDEFVVFLKGADDEEVIGEKAGAVLNAFRSTLAGHNAGHAISGSIGIASARATAATTAPSSRRRTAPFTAPKSSARTAASSTTAAATPSSRPARGAGRNRTPGANPSQSISRNTSSKSSTTRTTSTRR